MLPLIGAVFVFVCVLGSFMAMGGNLMVLWQPFEALIVVGAAVGAFVIGNPWSVLRAMPAAIRTLLRGPRHDKDSYLELMSLLYAIFRMARSKGPLALEQHIEQPETSDLFARFPHFRDDPAALTFLTDYLRLVSLGSARAGEIEALMDEELDTHTAENERIVNAIQTVADATPALGIVAAVLGVIKTMAAIDQPPEVLGSLIGGALVGTFLGVFLAYGFIGPVASALRTTYETEAKYLHAIRAALVAHVQGYSPAIAVEFARKSLMSDVRPTFQEVEDATAQVQPA
ncbi:flagellar motor stator protein MotA [Futiania mangrovi]|uniref:Flagellar motor stator protein MotA n=1 Tax=Futiania mangrovi TaxID=2959716 RepID=A0A9J6PE44_9PROT|nr:flagellar motor stator protein MotA [Futiania mangrovii]MCP1336096.1 flagellar motor stator protein MotA [Futiania mangrovii]